MADALVSALPRTEIVRLSSTDLDHTRSLLNRFYYPVAVGAPNGPTGFAFDLHVIQLGPLTFGEVSFRTPATVVATELPGYHVTLPTVGSVLTRQAGSELIAGPERAAVFRPGHPVYSLHAARSSELDIKIDRGALESELESLLGRSIHGPIDLAPALSSVSGPGQSWSRLVRLLRDELDHPQSLIQHPLIAEQIRHSVLCGLLLCLPHRYHDELTAPARPGPPRAIRRAIDAIHDEPERAFSVADLATVAGMSVRSLQEGFRRHVGCAPMAYVQQIRLVRAHEALRHADPHRVTVASVAHRWGFAHLGRFASTYRTRFGVSPSETLRDSR
jgi:AraC-like DNA-binding protein